ncbi:MAG: selenocysteine-specific translation elongation factor [Calditerrivibrio sp.]|nr:selenocysteine-specific translation elongation factor [Calditerrivibrio sp.]
MKNIIVGTAGHIDHGKSTIVKTLTGIDPDRLKEEKKRGITIDLGFAYIEDGEYSFSFVDVPGHEDYLKNMAAGAIGFDLCVFAVDINEGVMPQTIEHANIVKFLGIEYVVVVVTKIDKFVGDVKSRLESIRLFFNRYGFKRLEYQLWSVYDTNCRYDLLVKLKQFADVYERRSRWNFFMLHIDRVFSVKGFGTVVTGSCLSGSIKVGDSLKVLPKGKLLKVRGLSVHNKKVDEVGAGCRLAINFSDVERNELDRGDIVTSLMSLENYSEAFARIDYFDTGLVFNVKHGGEYQILIGTADMVGRLYVLERFESAVWVRVVFRKDYPLICGAKFLLRIPNPKMTVAGGKILFSGTFKGKKSELKEMLKAMEEKRWIDAISIYLKSNTYLEINTVFQRFLLSNDQLEGRFFELEGRYYDIDLIKKLKDELAGKVDEEGRLNLSELESMKDGVLKRYISEWIVDYGRKNGFVVRDGGLVREDDSFKRLAMDVLNLMLNRLEMSNSAVISEVINTDKVEIEKALKFLSNKGLIKKIDKNDNYIALEILTKFISDVVNLCRKDGYVDISNVRTIITAPRKILIPLLEFLDMTGLFVKKDNKRFLKK